MQHLQPSTTLQGGKYRIERVLGQGGFGITYLAKRKSDGSKVAIKELFVAHAGQAINSRDGNEVVVTNVSNQEQFEKHKTKFKKEAERLATYHHQNIVKVSECFEENGTVYYVMTFIEGESLRSKLNREGALPEELVLNYLCQLLDALSVIHRDKIWHLDLKPDNIMVDKDDHIYLIDFGASKHIVQGATLTTSSMMAFTPGYYPPEQISPNIRNIGSWTDVYALGATIYNLLTKKKPPTFDAIFSEGKNAFFFTSKISSSARDLIIMMMNPNRNERLRSVFAVREFLNIEKKQKDELKRQQEVTIVEHPRQYKNPSLEERRKELRERTDNGDTNQNNNSIIGWIIGIAVVVIVGFFIFNNHENEERTSYSASNSGNIESISHTVQPQETTKDIYKERVEQFVKKQSGIIASFPNDNRYSVYYTKIIDKEFNHMDLYHYDALTDKTNKMDLPIEATTGYITDIWLTKNKRYIFVAAKYRYTDFIRIDTRTNQVRYITDCYQVKKHSNGFIVTKAECYNEYEATYSADMLYEYTDYYYDDEGNYTGNHGNTYR